MLQRRNNRLMFGMLGAAFPVLALADIAEQICRDDPRPALCKARVCDRVPAACGVIDPPRSGTSNVLVPPGPGGYNQYELDSMVRNMRKAAEAAADIQGMRGAKGDVQGMRGAKGDAPNTRQAPSR